MAPGERAAAILARLQRQLAYAYESAPFYRRLYDAHGVKPSDIRSLEEFTTRVPVVRKDMLRASQEAHPPFGDYLGAPASPLMRVQGTSGTTGRPTLFAISRDDWGRMAEVQALCFWTAGVRPSDIVQIAMPMSLFVGGWGALQAAERIGALAFPIGTGQTQRQLELMERVGSTVLVATPSFALHLLEVARQNGVQPDRSPLRLGIFIGEPGAGLPATKRLLERGWGIKAIDGGNTAEVHPLTNIECEERRGMHTYLDVDYTEIVRVDDPHTPVPMGERGVVIYTHLERESQPMIRFWSGDLSRMTDEPCPCGRTYPRLPDGIIGRLDDLLIIRGAKVYPSAIQEALFEVAGAGREFRVLLTRTGGLDEATIQIEGGGPQGAEPSGARGPEDRELGERVARYLKERLGLRFAVEVVPENTWPRFETKARRVIDQRAPAPAPESALGRNTDNRSGVAKGAGP